MLGLFRPLEEYIGPSILIVGDLRCVVFFSFMLKLSSKFISLSFVESGIVIVLNMNLVFSSKTVYAASKHVVPKVV
jgi:hypothetical protein